MCHSSDWLFSAIIILTVLRCFAILDFLLNPAHLTCPSLPPSQSLPHRPAVRGVNFTTRRQGGVLMTMASPPTMAHSRLASNAASCTTPALRKSASSRTFASQQRIQRRCPPRTPRRGRLLCQPPSPLLCPLPRQQAVRGVSSTTRTPADVPTAMAWSPVPRRSRPASSAAL